MEIQTLPLCITMPPKATSLPLKNSFSLIFTRPYWLTTLRLVDSRRSVRLDRPMLESFACSCKLWLPTWLVVLSWFSSLYFLDVFSLKSLKISQCFLGKCCDLWQPPLLLYSDIGTLDAIKEGGCQIAMIAAKGHYHQGTLNLMLQSLRIGEYHCLYQRIVPFLITHLLSWMLKKPEPTLLFSFPDKIDLNLNFNYIDLIFLNNN